MSEQGAIDLSVILPTYNYGHFLMPAIESVLSQVPEGRTVEIVVADDGSTDDTADLVRELGRTALVRYARQENQGPAAARNLALGQARGRYLMFLDADDFLCDDCVGTTLDFLDRNPEVGLFFTNYDIYDEEGLVCASGVDIWKRFRRIPHREVGPGEWIFTESLTPHIVHFGGFMHTSGLTLRREVYEQIGDFQVGFNYGEDDEYYARAAWVATAGYVDKVLARKRNHAASLIHNPQNSIRNAQHHLELSEIQAEYYREDPQMRAILDRKIPGCVWTLCWRLIHARQRVKAREVLWRYRARYPRHWPFYRLLIRTFLPDGRPS